MSLEGEMVLGETSEHADDVVAPFSAETPFEQPTSFKEETSTTEATVFSPSVVFAENTESNEGARETERRGEELLALLSSENISSEIEVN